MPVVLKNFGLTLLLVLTLSAAKPQKIVSQFIGGDALLLELLEGQHERLVGLSALARSQEFSPVYDRIPQGVALIGGELESLLALGPDLVVAASYTRKEWLAKLKVSGINHLVLKDFSSVTDIFANISKIAAAIGEVKAGQKLIAAMKVRLAKLKGCALAGKSVLNYSEDGIFLGSGTIFNDLLQRANINNLAAKVGIAGWQKMTPERLGLLKADYLLVAGDPERAKRLRKKLGRDPLWKHMPAVIHGRIIAIPSRDFSAVSHHSLSFIEGVCRG